MCLETKKNGEKPEIRVGFVSRPAGSGWGSNPDPRVGSGSTRNALLTTHPNHPPCPPRNHPKEQTLSAYAMARGTFSPTPETTAIPNLGDFVPILMKLGGDV